MGSDRIADDISVAVVAAQLCARVPGGTGRYTRELLRALAGSASAHGSVQALLPRGCTVDDLGSVVCRSLGLPDRVLSRFWERGWPPYAGGADVVHAPTLLVPPVSRGVGLVVTVHDVVPWTHPATLTPRGVAFHRHMAARAAATADIVLTPSAVVATAVGDVLGHDVDVRTIPPVVVDLGTPADPVRRRQAAGVRPFAYILFVGTAEPRKGLAALVAAMAEPSAAHLDLVVVGPPGWGGVDVAALAEAAGIADRVVVTGRVDDETLAACYDGARAVAVPSLAEGFGLPVVEAMSRGIPVVTSDDPALVEAGGGAALVVRAGDPSALAEALRRAATDGPERESLRTRGGERARSFSAAATAERLWHLYAEVSDRHRGGG